MTAHESVPIEELLAHRAWVRALARRLVADESGAEDLEQDAWVRALSRPPGHARSLHAWFRRIVRSTWIDAHRADRQRTAREAAVARPEATSQDDVVLAADAHRRVVQAAYGLPEPYRTALLLRYFEGLSIGDVARRMDAPKETVRTRLRRALVLMRTQLDEEAGGDRGVWCAALLPLALGTGGLAMKTGTKAALAAAVLVALGGATLWWTGRPDVDVAARPAAVEATETASPKPHARAEAPAPNPFPGDASIRGEVRRIDDRTTVAGATVVLEDRASGRSARTTTDSAGRFAFLSIAPGLTLHVRAETADLACVARRLAELGKDESRDVGVVWLDGLGELEVNVEMAGGSAEGADVEVFGSAMSRWGSTSAVSAEETRRYGRIPLGSARTDSTGSAHLRIAAATTDVLVRKSGFVTAMRGAVDVRSGRVSRVRLVLVPGMSIRGRLLDVERHPLPDCILYGATDPQWGMVTAAYATATTEPDGAFELAGLAAGPVTVMLRTDAGPIVLAMVRAPSSERFDFVVQWTAVEGTVTCADDVRTVAGATVRAVDFSKPGQGTVLVTHTDAEGRYRIETIGAASIGGLQAEAPGLAAADVMRPEDCMLLAAGATAHRDLRVTRESIVEGRVLCGSETVPGAEVAAYWNDGSLTARRDATTDSTGAYRMAGIPPGRAVLVEVHAPGYSQDGWSVESIQALWGRTTLSPAWSVVAEPGKAAHLDIHVTRGRSVAGRVEDETGAPVVSASVYGGSERTVTANDGSFRLGGVPTGPRSQLGIHAEGFSYAPADLAADGDVADLRVVLRRAPHLRGTVRTSDGSALPNGAFVRVVAADMVAQHWDPAMAWRSAPVCAVHAEGSFDVVPAVVGELRVRAEAPHLVQSPVAVTLRDRDVAGVELVLSPSPRLDGHVFDATSGEPIPGARVEVDLAGPSKQGYVHTPVLAAISDATGAFAAVDLLPGTYPVTVKAEGRVDRSFEAVLPLEASLEVHLAKSAPFLAGVVLGPDRVPVAGASISVTPDDPSFGGEGGRWARTDDRGRFGVDGAPARGTWTVSVYPPQNRGFPNRWLKVTGVAAGTTDVEVNLGAARRIAGRVLGSDAKPASNVQVWARSEKNEAAQPTTQTDGSGAFVLDGLDDVHYVLQVSAPDERHDEAWSSVCRDLPTVVRDVEAGREDVVVTLDRGETISGTLVGDDGHPVAAAWITASPLRGQKNDRERPGRYPCAGLTDAEGRFTIGGLFTLRYHVSRLEGTGTSPTFTPLVGGEDVAAGATGLRLRVPSIATIAGRVVDESGKPVAEVHLYAVRGTERFASAETGPDGTFELQPLDASQFHVVEATKPGVLALERSDPVRPGTRDLTVRMKRGLHASGRVVDADGKSIGRVAVLHFVGEAGAADFMVKTDATGAFDVWGLSEGAWRVDAQVVTSANGKALHGSATLHAGDVDVELRYE